MEARSDPVTTALSAWQDALVDLRASNPLLDLAEQQGIIRLVQPAAGALFRALLAEPSPHLRLLASASTDEVDVIVAAAGPKPVPVTLRAMWQDATTARLEKGTHLLYVTFGTLHWQGTDRSELRSPLFLLPVRLDRASAVAHYTLTRWAPHPALAFNPALDLKLRNELRLNLQLNGGPGLPGELDEILERVREAVRLQRWPVDDAVYLGLFRSDNYELHEDLGRRAADCAAHPLIRALAGDRAASAALPKDHGRSAAELDELEDPCQCFQVLDADASQREAIDTVNQGTSLVIQGPPGTGKSQTITNIIAEALGRGRTVLFVSEKMAALRVVAQRLDAVGLGPFCLQLHDPATTLASVADELTQAATLDGGMGAPLTALPDPEAAAKLNRLKELRHDLNAYLRALCDAATPLGCSAYDVMGELAELADAPILRFDYAPALMGELTRDKLGELMRTLDDLLLIRDTVLQPEGNPWQATGIALTQRDPAARLALEERLQSLADAAGDLATLQTNLRLAWGLPVETSLAAADRLRSIFELMGEREKWPPLAGWFAAAEVQIDEAFAHTYADGHGEAAALRTDLLERYTAAMLQSDAPRALHEALTVSGRVLTMRPEAQASGAPAIPVATQICAGIVAGELTKLEQTAGEFAGAFTLRAPRTIHECEMMAQLARLIASGRRPVSGWFRSGKAAELQELVAEAAVQANILAGRAELAARFRQDFFSRAADDDLLARLQEPTWTAELRARLHADIFHLERTANHPEDLDRDEALKLVQQARAIQAAETWFDDHRSLLDAELAHFYNGPASNWAEMQTALAAAEDAVRTGLVAPGAPPPALVDYVPATVEDRQAVAVFGDRLAQVMSAWTLLQRELPSGQQPDWTLPDKPLSDIHAFLDTVMRGHPELAEPAGTLAACRHQPWTNLDELTKDLHDALRLNRLEEELRRRFGVWYRGPETDWNAICRSFVWVKRMRSHFQPDDPPPPFVNRLTQATLADQDAAIRLGEGMARVQAQVDRLAPFFLETSPLRGKGIETKGLDTLASWLRDLRAALPRLDEWIAYRHGQERAAGLQLSPFVAAVQDKQLPATEWAPAFRRQLLTLWLTWRQQQAPELADFYLTQVEARVAEFRDLDRWQIADSVRRLTAQLAAGRAAKLATPEVGSELPALRQAALASGEPRPLRQFFKQLPTLLPALKPCMLMSPTAVAQFLGESSILFDLVVFDEASQLTPAEAISSIVRGKQAVVVGDSQQMPPTSFFQASAASQDQPTADSLLEACAMAGFPEHMLRWHYRSRHEDLIAFSNHKFYNGQLVTFPAARRDIDAVVFERVEGIFGERKHTTNPIEAATLADLVVAEAKAHPTESLGAVAFSKEQMQAILDEIDKRVQDDEALGRMLRQGDPDGFFVRNLENVQGDERDVIFLSVGYGPDGDGRMDMRFGPLNVEGGERRLNVAITRARERMVVLASFSPEKMAGATSRGAVLLREYLEFARQGPQDAPRIGPPPPRPSPRFAQAVGHALKQAGLRIVTDVGASASRLDMAVQDEASDQFLVAIECDGAAYLASPTARDRERLRPQVLTGGGATIGGLGWPAVHRIWSAAWLNDPAGEIKRLQDTIERARQKLAASQMTPVSPPPVTPVGLTAPVAPPAAPVPVAPVIPEPIAPAPSPVSPAPAGPATATRAPVTAPPARAADGGRDDGVTDPGVNPDDGEFDVAFEGEPAPGAAPPSPPAAPPELLPRGAAAPTRTARKPKSPQPATGTKAAPKGRRNGHEPAVPAPPHGDHVPATSKEAADVSEIKGVSPALLAQLRERDIRTTAQFLAATNEPGKRQGLATALGIDVKALTGAAQRADLMRLDRVGTELSDLLAGAGVASCKVLRHRKPDNLHQTLLAKAAALGHPVSSVPPEEMIAAWIAQAKRLAEDDEREGAG